MSYADVPAPWRALVSELNGGRIPDGEPGIRDVDAPCEAFRPAGDPFEAADGSGTCETDGHHICSECVHIERATLRRRRGQCETTGMSYATCDCRDCVDVRTLYRGPT